MKLEGFARNLPKSVVIDTNVLVSAFLTPKGICGQILVKLIQSQTIILTSSEHLEEVYRVLPLKTSKNRSLEDVQRFLHWFTSASTLTKTEHVFVPDVDADDLFLFGIGNSDTHTIWR